MLIFNAFSYKGNAKQYSRFAFMLICSESFCNRVVILLWTMNFTSEILEFGTNFAC